MTPKIPTKLLQFDRLHFCRRRRSGFTLVELLVVIAVTAILATLLIVGIGKVRSRADFAVSTSNLRSIGTAISLYINENQGNLPGPLVRGQRATYGLGPNSLLDRVGPYMGLGPPPTTSAERRYIDAFACPAWRKSVDDDNAVVWWLNMEGEVDGSAARREPWGYPFTDNRPPTDPRRSPVKHMQIANPARQMAMQSADGEIGPWAGIPEKPVFGDVRNRLFFDWHVEAVPVEAGREIYWPVR